jgi:hypothetical protein
MSDNRGTVRTVAWRQVFPSLRLFSAIRMALNFKALLLAAIATAGTVAGWRVLGGLFGGEDDASLVLKRSVTEVWPWERPVPALPLDHLTSLDAWRAHSPLVVAWNEVAGPFRQMYEAPTFTSFAYLLACALWGLLVWSFFGGAITRLAAVSFARQENVSLGELTRFVNGRLSAYFVAPLFPMLGTLFVVLMLAALGALLRLDFLAVPVAVAWPLVLFGGFVMAFLLLGVFFGFPLMWGAISAEGTDSFGALSHAYSYVYQRPLQFLGYVVVAAAAGVLGWMLVALFVQLTFALGEWSVAWGSGSDRVASLLGPEETSDLAGAIVGFWRNGLLTLAYGFVFSYFWTASTVIYFLLRRLVDASELDEVYMPADREPHGLPTLRTGRDGVPEVVVDPVMARDSASDAD